MLTVGLIGAGQAGRRRAANLAGATLVAVCDRVRERAAAIAIPAKADILEAWEKLVDRKDLDVVIVSTTPEWQTRCAVAALEAGKHVLVESPAGANPRELAMLVKAAKESKRILRVGFNHRFRPGFQRAKDFLRAKAIGPLTLIRARSGHGGSQAYQDEWQDSLPGNRGGELLHQGIPLIDLCRWLGGEWDFTWGKASTLFWPIPAEDNGFVFLESPDRSRSALLHAGSTEWTGLFDFELFGKAGKLQVTGLSQKDEPEELRCYQRNVDGGALEETAYPFPADHMSWKTEFEAFVKEITGQKTDIGTAQDALRAIELVFGIYEG